MTEGPARDDDSDAVDTRGSTSEAASSGAAPLDSVPPDGMPPEGPPSESPQPDGDADGHDADAQAGREDVHDQPTRPAYGHLYGVERSLDSFLPLQDVVFAVDEAFLEALRDFAAYALADMRRLGDAYDHLHFRDVAQVWHESWPDIILVAPRAPAAPAAQAEPEDDAQNVDASPDQ